MTPPEISPETKNELIKRVLQNRISVPDLVQLRTLINATDLSDIIKRIYDLNKKEVFKLAALGKAMAFADDLKNSHRNAKFMDRIKKDFRKGENKIVLVEGDSWFNYPVILSDVIDWISMQSNLATYSLASGGDWLLNMLNSRKYVEQLSVMHPDVFLISAGGNDLVGNYRVGAIVDPSGNSGEFFESEWARMLIGKAIEHPIVDFNRDRFDRGVGYLAKDFFSLLMFFHLQYYFLINGILRGGTEDPENGKFPGIKIITQGYDYAIPSDDLHFGPNPLKWFVPFVRMFLGHGKWLRRPLQLRGIVDRDIQKDLVYAMIFLFNEMMIYTGDFFCNIKGIQKSVFHIDSRGTMGDMGWTDELHPLPENFKRVGSTFIDCINGRPSRHGQVYVVNEFYPS